MNSMRLVKTTICRSLRRTRTPYHKLRNSTMNRDQFLDAIASSLVKDAAAFLAMAVFIIAAVLFGFGLAS